MPRRCDLFVSILPKETLDIRQEPASTVTREVCYLKKVKMEVTTDPIRLIPTDVWARVLSHVECLSIAQWLSWRTISKQWCSSMYRLLSSLSVDYQLKDRKPRKLRLELLSGGLRSFSLSGPIVPLVTLPVDTVDFLTNFSVSGLDTMLQIERLRLCNLGSLLEPSTLISASQHWPLLRDLSLKGIEVLDTDVLGQILANTPFLTRLSLQGVYGPMTTDNLDSMRSLEGQTAIKLESLSTIELDDCPFSLVTWLPLTHVRHLRLLNYRSVEASAFDLLRVLPDLETIELQESNVIRFSSLSPQEPNHAHVSSPVLDLLGGFSLFPALTRLVLDEEPHRVENPPPLIDLSLIFQLPQLAYLSTWRCCLAAPTPPDLTLGETPPPLYLPLKEWRVAPAIRGSSWTWAVLQLVPNLTSLTAASAYNWSYGAPIYPVIALGLTAATILGSGALPELKELNFRAEINDDGSLQSGGPPTSLHNAVFLGRLKTARFPSTKTGLLLSMLNPAVLERLDVSHSDIESSLLLQELCTMGSAHRAPKDPSGLTVPKISRSPPYSTNFILRALDISSSKTLGPSCLSVIAKQFPNLEWLDVSYIPGIWATHLRYIEPMRCLTFIGHAVLNRPEHSISGFQTLKGMWPRLSVLKIEKRISVKMLATIFGPLVSLELV